MSSLSLFGHGATCEWTGHSRAGIKRPRRRPPTSKRPAMFALALFGAGRIGSIHAQNAARHPDLLLKYVVDPIAVAAERVAASAGATVASVETALGDPEVAGIVVASSTDQHLDQCLAAAAAGKAIFCEKPVDLDLARVQAA